MRSVYHVVRIILAANASRLGSHPAKKQKFMSVLQVRILPTATFILGERNHGIRAQKSATSRMEFHYEKVEPVRLHESGSRLRR